jgi:uncharacterized protein
MSNFSRIIQIVLAGGLLWGLIPSSPARAAFPSAAAQPTLQAATNTGNECATGRTIQVTGSATVNVIPDRAVIELGVQSNAASVDAVEAANSASIQKVITAIKNLGVDAKDIATDIYLVEPVYESYDSLYIKGYRINNMVSVTLRDIQKVSRVVSVALKAGANQVQNVEFYTSELRKYRDQARELAVKAAQEKAQALASTAGAEVGCILSINENTWSYYNGWWYGRNQNLWTQNTVQNASPAGGTGSSNDEPISLGQISIKAEISSSYSLN